MPRSTHSQASELHNLAAHVHSAAATAHGKGDHRTATELSRLAHEHSMNVHKYNEEDPPKSTQPGPAEGAEDLAKPD